MSADERRWRAESDADTMARYEEIMADRARRTAAVKAAQARADALNRQAAVMNRVAGAKSQTRKK